MDKNRMVISLKKIWSYRYPTVLLLVFALVWQGVTVVFDIPTYILPTPLKVMQATWKLRELLFGVHLLATVEEMVIGFVISCVLGIALAMLMTFVTSLKAGLYPLVVASQTIPIMAISPIFILWFGYGLASKVAVTIVITFFPVVISAYQGFAAGDPDAFDVMQSMGASRWQIFWKLQFPSGLSQLFSGLKMAATFSVVGATIGEWLGGDVGLGYFTKRMQNSLRAPEAFSAVLVLALLGVAAFVCIALLQRVTMPWKYRSQK